MFNVTVNYMILFFIVIYLTKIFTNHLHLLSSKDTTVNKSLLSWSFKMVEKAN